MVHSLQDQATRPIPGLVPSAARSWENLDHFRGDLGRKYQAGRCVMAERVGFESTRKRNFRELRGMMSILRHSKKSFRVVIAP
jgi:hypothetical protein